MYAIIDKPKGDVKYGYIMAGKNKLQIRNSTVDFLVFTKDSHEEGI